MLEQVGEFKYSGSILQANGKVNKEIKNRISCTNRTIGAFREFTRDRGIRKDGKLKIFNTIIIPTLTYASETK